MNALHLLKNLREQATMIDNCFIDAFHSGEDEDNMRKHAFDDLSTATEDGQREVLAMLDTINELEKLLTK